MLFNLVAICVQDFGAVINKSVVMVSSFHAIISVTVHDIELLTIHFKWTIWCRGFFHGYSFITILMILNHALRYWQLDHVIIIFQCFPFGLSFVLPFFRSNHRFVFCLLCSGIAVSMVMKYADNIVKVRTIFFFNYMCWKQCCSKVQHLVLRLIELLYQYSTIFSANGNTFTHFVTSGCVYWDTTLLCLIGNQ